MVSLSLISRLALSGASIFSLPVNLATDQRIGSLYQIVLVDSIPLFQKLLLSAVVVPAPSSNFQYHTRPVVISAGKSALEMSVTSCVPDPVNIVSGEYIIV